MTEYQRAREPKPLEIKVSTEQGLTFNKWGALAIVFSINAPFLSEMARNVRDTEGFYLWSSPTLVLTVAKAGAAYWAKSYDESDGLMRAAIDYCNSYLPAQHQLPDNTVLRLAWADHGLASVTREERRNEPGTYMDIVKTGVATSIIDVGFSSDVWRETGEPRRPRNNNGNHRRRDGN